MDHRASLDRYSSNLPGEPTRADGGGKLHSGAALIHPLGVSMYSVRRVPAWPSTYPFPQGRVLANFFVLPFDRFVFALYHFARSHTPWCGLFLPPFAVSHDLTHLGRKVREHIPLKKISHALGTRTGQYYGISHSFRFAILARNTRDLDLGRLPQNLFRFAIPTDGPSGLYGSCVWYLPLISLRDSRQTSPRM